jgi:hypothetical protein
MKRFKKAMRLYLARSKETGVSFSTYVIGTRKKDWNGADFDNSHIASFCSEDFERVTGVRLEEGEVARVRIVIEDA